MNQYRSEQFGDVEFSVDVLTPGEPGAWQEPDPLLKLGFDPDVAEYLDIGLKKDAAYSHAGISTPKSTGAFLKNGPEFLSYYYQEPQEDVYEILRKKGMLRSNIENYQDWASLPGEISSTDFVGQYDQGQGGVDSNDIWRHEYRHRGVSQAQQFNPDIPLANLTKEEEETLLRLYDYEYGRPKIKAEAKEYINNQGEAVPTLEHANKMAREIMEPEAITPLSRILSLFN